MNWRQEARTLSNTFAWIHDTDDPTKLRLAVVDLQSSFEHILIGFVNEAKPNIDPHSITLSELLNVAWGYVSFDYAIVKDLNHFNYMRDRVVHQQASVEKDYLETAFTSMLKFTDSLLIADIATGLLNTTQYGDRGRSEVQQNRHLTRPVDRAKQAAEKQVNGLRIGSTGFHLSFGQIAGTIIKTNASVGVIAFVVLPLVGFYIVALIGGWQQADRSNTGPLGHLLWMLIAVVGLTLAVGLGGEIALIFQWVQI